VVVLREEADEWAILFNPDTSDAVGINPAGVGIWKLLDGKRTVEELRAGLQGEFENVPPSASDEIEQFLSQLRSMGFIAAGAGDRVG
jgi:SynChlorMet cassette protein ScmD